MQEKTAETSEKNWNKINRMVCGVIMSCSTQEIKCHVMNETPARKIWEIFESKYSTKSIENLLYLKRRFYRFQLKKIISIGDYMNNYTKIFADLTNVDEVIKDDDNAFILLSSLPVKSMGTSS